MGRIEDQWESFRRQIIPVDAPEIQIKEMKKAFYAGAFSLFSSIMTMLDPGADPTENDLNNMSEIYTELKQFFKDIGVKEPQFSVVDGIMRKVGRA